MRYMQCEGTFLADQISQKLGKFYPMLEGSHSIFYCKLDTYQKKIELQFQTF